MLKWDWESTLFLTLYFIIAAVPLVSRECVFNGVDRVQKYGLIPSLGLNLKLKLNYKNISTLYNWIDNVL